MTTPPGDACPPPGQQRRYKYPPCRTTACPTHGCLCPMGVGYTACPACACVTPVRPDPENWNEDGSGPRTIRIRIARRVWH